jgi:hypothetical protein
VVYCIVLLLIRGGNGFCDKQSITLVTFGGPECCGCRCHIQHCKAATLTSMACYGTPSAVRPERVACFDEQNKSPLPGPLCPRYVSLCFHELAAIRPEMFIRSPHQQQCLPRKCGVKSQTHKSAPSPAPSLQPSKVGALQLLGLLFPRLPGSFSAATCVSATFPYPAVAAHTTIFSRAAPPSCCRVCHRVLPGFAVHRHGTHATLGKARLRTDSSVGPELTVTCLADAAQAILTEAAIWEAQRSGKQRVQAPSPHLSGA